MDIIVREDLENDYSISVEAIEEEELIGHLDVWDSYEPTIWNFRVSQEWRNRGVGSSMLTKTLEEVKRFFPKAEYIELVVDKGNEAAIRLYKRFGFEFVSDHPWGRMTRPL